MERSCCARRRRPTAACPRRAVRGSQGRRHARDQERRRAGDRRPRVRHRVGPARRPHRGSRQRVRRPRRSASWPGSSIDGLAGPSEVVDGRRRHADPSCARSTWSRRPNTTRTRSRTSLLDGADSSRGVLGASSDEVASRRPPRDHRGRAPARRAILVTTTSSGGRGGDDLAAEHLLILLPRAACFPNDPQRRRDLPRPPTAVPFGDYGVASNHVLPTAGTARFSSGLRAADHVTCSMRGGVTRDAAPRAWRPETSTIAAQRGPGRARARDGRPRGGTEMSRDRRARPGLRDVAPYVSPQLDVAVRLNTNECPHPLPDGFSRGPRERGARRCR